MPALLCEQRHQECSCEESQWDGVSFLRTITPMSSVLVLPLMVLSKPSSKGSAMACAMSPAGASVPTAGTGSAQFRALLDQGSSLYVCSHQGLCVGFMCSLCLLWVCFHIQDLPLLSSLCHPHCPFPPWLLCLPCCSCTPAESQGAVPEGVCI